MPPPRVRTRTATPIEEAKIAVESALPDPNVGRKPFYTFYILSNDGLWCFVFKDTVRDRVVDAMVQNRKNRIITYTDGDNAEFKEGVLVDKDLVAVFRRNRGQTKAYQTAIIRNDKTPTLSVMVYYGTGGEYIDLQLIQIDTPSEAAEKMNIEGFTRSFIFWGTQLTYDLGFDPKTDSQVRCYFTDKNQKPVYVKHIQEVIDFCLKNQ